MVKVNIDEEMYELTLLEEHNFHYGQCLMESLQGNAKLVTISFHRDLPGGRF